LNPSHLAVYVSLLRKIKKFCNNLSLIYDPRSKYEGGFEEKKIIVSEYII